jgi:hypothetical protein
MAGERTLQCVPMEITPSSDAVCVYDVEWPGGTDATRRWRETAEGLPGVVGHLVRGLAPEQAYRVLANGALLTITQTDSQGMLCFNYHGAFPAGLELAPDFGGAAPSVDSSNPETPFTMAEGRVQAFSVWVSDPDNDPLSFVWALDGEPLADATGSSWTYRPGFDAAGPHWLSVTVSDGTHSAEHVWEIAVTNRLPGDLNQDHVVNVDDLVLVTRHFGRTTDDPQWDPYADADNNGVVNLDDLGVVVSGFGLEEVP